MKTGSTISETPYSDDIVTYNRISKENVLITWHDEILLKIALLQRVFSIRFKEITCCL